MLPAIGLMLSVILVVKAFDLLARGFEKEGTPQVLLVCGSMISGFAGFVSALYWVVNGI